MNNKRKIGDKIGSWTIISKRTMSRPHMFYTCQCMCGHTNEFPTNRMSRLTKCMHCAGRTPINTNHELVGTSHGRLTCLSRQKDGKLQVKCACGLVYLMELNQYRQTNSCRKCRRGNFPGSVQGNCTLIEPDGVRSTHKFWKKKCVCGAIFVGEKRKTDCGCIAKNKRMEQARKKIGTSKDMLTIKKVIKGPREKIAFILECECGNKIQRVNGHEFKSKSCGCLVGAKKGEENHSAILTNNDVLSVRELFDSKLYTVDEISKMIDMPLRTINRILSGHSWSDIQ